jgi:hypothetical protein
MKHHTLLSAALATTMLAAANLAQAATVEIEWQDPDKYYDVRATNEGQDHFLARVQTELTKAFTEGASKLPQNQTLHLTITNVDLAGEVEYFHPGFPFGLRVLRRVDSPSLKLQYELRDANGQVLQGGDGRLTDLGYDMPSLPPSSGRNPLRYEKDMILDWMAKTFPQES